MSVFYYRKAVGRWMLAKVPDDRQPKPLKHERPFFSAFHKIKADEEGLPLAVLRKIYPEPDEVAP